MKREKKGEEGQEKKKWVSLSEQDRKAGFALLALLAVGLAAYALLFSEPHYEEADLETFVQNAINSPSIALFYDLRGASGQDNRVVFQCGVDIAGGSLFGSKNVSIFACDDGGCISTTSSSKGESKLTYEQVKKRLLESPYVLIKRGAPATKFFANHAEISIDESFEGQCKLG